MMPVMSEVILHGDFDLDKAIGMFEKGANLYDVCKALDYNREGFAAWVKADPTKLQRVTEARREGADCLVTTYKDMLLKELKVAEDPRDRISLIREIGTHIRWEAQAVHSGTYAPRSITEHTGKLALRNEIQLSDEQIREMAAEVLATAGDSFGKPATSA
jgi:hypothetical protein